MVVSADVGGVWFVILQSEPLHSMPHLPNIPLPPPSPNSVNSINSARFPGRTSPSPNFRQLRGGGALNPQILFTGVTHIMLLHRRTSTALTVTAPMLMLDVFVGVRDDGGTVMGQGVGQGVGQEVGWGWVEVFWGGWVVGMGWGGYWGSWGC